MEVIQLAKTILHRIIIGCLLLCLITLTACAGETPTSSGGDTSDTVGDVSSPSQSSSGETIDISMTNSSIDNPPLPMAMDSDMGIEIDGRWFPIWNDAEGILSALGDGYELYSAPSCVFVGEDKEFAYNDCNVYTNPDGDRDIWYSVYLLTDAFSTSRGIRVGSSLDEIFAAYGERFYWEGEEILSYSISGIKGDIESPCIQFFLSDDFVTAIDIYYPTNVS